MSKATVLALIGTLSNSQADQTALSSLYDNVLVEFSEEDFFTNFSTFNLTKGQLEVSFGASSVNAVNIMGIIYDGRQLDEVTLQQLSMIDSHWRDALGRPTSFVVEDENQKVVAFYPAPNQDSIPPNLVGVVFFNDAPYDPDSPQYWLELPIALRVMEREFTRESDHEHPELSEVCGMLHKLFVEMVS